jgi:hypothetical protein
VAEKSEELRVAKDAFPVNAEVPETERVFREVEPETLRVPEEEIPAVESERAETVASPSSIVTGDADKPVEEDVFNNSL